MKKPIQNFSDKYKAQLLRQWQALFKTVVRKEEQLVEFLTPITSSETDAPLELQIASEGAKHARQRIIGSVRLGLSQRRVDAQIAALMKWRGALVVIFLFLSTSVIYVFSRRITRPIKQLTDQATRIADGYLDQTILVDSRDEIGQLGVSFNAMARNLKENIDEKELVLAQLRELNQTLEDRIRQRTSHIEKMNAQLRDATRHKSEFLANVNHELRTPISTIIGYARLVLRKTKGQISPHQRENLQDLLKTSESLLGMINGLLDLARIEAGRMDVRAEPVQIDELVYGTVSSMEPMLKQDRVRLVREIEPGLAALNTDPEKLRQIMLNLLGNAVKFTEEGEIKVFASQQNGSFKLAVSDTGIGIAKEDLNHIFEEFRRGDSSNGSNHGGTGLGLAIVKKFVDLLGGEITVDSELGKGSIFTVTLPVDHLERA